MSNRQISPMRSILYYPTISIPTGDWLRQSVLYWDEVGSIVPQDYDNNPLLSYSRDVQYLKEEGQFRPFRPDALMGQSWQKVESFEKEFMAIVESPNFQLVRERNRRPFLSRSLSLRQQDLISINSKIHQDKISHNLFYYLKEKGLALEGDREWYHFDDLTALLYMALLAKYLADIDINVTVPGTDQWLYQDLIYKASSEDEGIPCISTNFQKLLPIPRPDTPIKKIVNFKRKRRNELLHFRQLIDGFQKDLAKCESEAEANEIGVRFSESIERGLEDLKATMHDAHLAVIPGSLSTIIKLNSPALWATGVVLAGHATKIADIPLEWSGVGIGVLGAIEIATYIIDRRNEDRARLRESPFSFLYHAQQDKLFSKAGGAG
jgi:hypothetical protein